MGWTMNSGLDRRLSRLEKSNNKDAPLELRAWFGERLTDEERAELARRAAMPQEPYTPPTDADLDAWGPDFREWWRARHFRDGTSRFARDTVKRDDALGLTLIAEYREGDNGSRLPVYNIRSDRYRALPQHRMPDDDGDETAWVAAFDVIVAELRYNQG
jgi:hypothetical protein